MKLRQRLAVVLASTMVLTSVPAVTMAASDTKITNGIVTGTSNATLTKDQKLIITVKDDATTDGMFFLNLSNAEWDNVVQNSTVTSSNASATITTQVGNGKKELAVQFNKTGTTASTIITVDLRSAVKLASGDATIAVDGNDTVISDVSPIVFATTSDAKANVTGGTPTTLYYEESAIGDVIIEEPLTGKLTSGSSFKVYLENTDFKFVATSSNVNVPVGTATGSKGLLAASGTTLASMSLNGAGDIITVTMATTSNLAPGRIVLSGIKVVGTNKTPVTGDLKVTVSDDNSNINTTTVKVADIKTFGVTLAMKDSKPVDVVEGAKVATTFSFTENTRDCMVANRTVEVTLDKGYFADGNIDTTAANTLINTIAKAASFTNFATGTTGSALDIKLTRNSSNYVTGFTFTVPNTIDRNQVSAIKFDGVNVYAPLMDAGAVTLTAEGRALYGDKLSTQILNVKDRVNVTFEPVTLKVGQQGQEGGKITITETDKEMLKTGTTTEVNIKLENKDAGISIDSIGTLKLVSGDIKVENYDYYKDANGNKIGVKFTVKRMSTVASTLEITGLKFTTNRSVPQGTYNATVDGAAIEPDCSTGTITLSKFINVATPNTEELATNGLKKVSAAFVIGSNKYTVDGVTKEMDATAYVENGRTMVPLRFAANALGVADTDIYFADNTASVVVGGKTYSVKLGSKTAYVNGVPAQTMLVAPVMKNDRIYIPISELGKLLGVTSSWDEATQTATFTNK